ncbi:Fungal-trans domain-containing protein [Mycena venus]|uniref:Fungal-trans domain-containing protein n=1 Tax=Mycena venus TaxID=2733690 RepID=A0A8H7D8L7_9AGAR|nr:Fungal-trans domain-containing protein [Mycena venus]
MSDDEEYYYGSGFTRQRRTLRSCDFCRQRKIRCQRPPSAEDDDSPCSSCLKFGTHCTFTHPVGKRGPKNRLVEDLRREIASLQAQLRSRSLGLCRLCAQPLGTQAQDDKNVFHHSTPESDTTASSESREPPDEEDAPTDELSTRFNQFSLQSIKTSYFGSAFALPGNSIATKAGHEGRPLPRSRRPAYWEMSPWEKEAYDIRSQYETRPNYVFPDRDLIDSLVALYFANFHVTTPILHRPSFERAVAEGLYVRDMAFGGLLLSVLALASRYSSDPRVLIDGNPLSAGWRFQNQVRVLRRLFEPTIHEIQIYCLMSYYALGGSVPQVAWVYIGLGMRFLQQRGEYARKPAGQRPGSEDELWKRAFWSFAVLERMLCLILGRPMCLHVENYDIDFPVEVDDEYWDQGPELKQPAGVPSRLSYFVHHLRLCEIVGDAVRKLYGSKKSKLMLGWDGPQWEQRMAAELDSDMNNFFRFNPGPSSVGSCKPATGRVLRPICHSSSDLQLYSDRSQNVACYPINPVDVFIQIHRPFIHKATGGLASPSLSICCKAARTVIHIADTWVSKLQRIPMPSLIVCPFSDSILS